VAYLELGPEYKYENHARKAGAPTEIRIGSSLMEVGSLTACW